MSIEEEIFKRTKIDFAKILEYGFKKENDLYKYSKNIMNNTFKVDIEINNDGIVTGKVFDLSTGYEYTNFRIENLTGPFIGQVREEFEEILKDIRNKCFIKKPFISEQANRISEKIKIKYGDEPSFEWEKFPLYAVFRNSLSKKWYGIMMNLDKSKIDVNATGEVEIIDIKLEPNKIQRLLKEEGFYPAYHMNKKNWITIVLDDTVLDEEIMNLIDESYSYADCQLP